MTNKTMIAVRMEKLYRKMGRDPEIREIQEYLDIDRGSGQMSGDEDDEDAGSFI